MAIKIGRCGWARLYEAVALNKSVKLRKILQSFREGKYADKDEVEKRSGKNLA